MADPVQITFFKGADGVSSVRFEMAGLEKYALVFCGQGKVTLYIPDPPQGRLMRFGQALIISQELKIDLGKIGLQAVSTSGNAAAGSSQAPVVLVKSLKRLCGVVNSYFTDRAAFYWTVPPADCYVKDAYVCTRNRKIAYSQLVAFDMEFYYKTRNVA